MLDHRFAAPVLRYETGFRHYYIPIPADVAAAYEEAGVRRLAGSIKGSRSDVPFKAGRASGYSSSARTCCVRSAPRKARP